MRLQRYLNEKFYNGFMHYGTEIEVFVNPSSKELKELKDNNSEIRFLANMKEKKVYMWDGDRVTHEDAVDGGVMPTSGFNYRRYVFTGENADIIFGGTVLTQSGKLESDSWDARPTANYPKTDLEKMADKSTLESVRKMTKNNFSWLKKYGVDPKATKDIVDSLYARLLGMEANGEL